MILLSLWGPVIAVRSISFFPFLGHSRAHEILLFTVGWESLHVDLGRSGGYNLDREGTIPMEYFRKWDDCRCFCDARRWS